MNRRRAHLASAALAALLAAPLTARADIAPDPALRDPRTNDHFGHAIARLGDQLLIGAPGDNDFAFNGGAIYVFEGAALVDKLAPTDLRAHTWFGAPIAADGDTILVGGIARSYGLESGVLPRPRSAAILRRDRDRWIREAYLVHGDPDELADRYGAAVALAGDHAALAANFVQIGDAYAGARVDLFHRGDGIWALAGRIYYPEGTYGVDRLTLAGDHLVLQQPPLRALAWIDGVWVDEPPPPGLTAVDAALALPGAPPRLALAVGLDLHIFRHEGAWVLDQTLPLPCRVITSGTPLAAAPGRLAAICEPHDAETRAAELVVYREDEGAWLALGEPLRIEQERLDGVALALDAGRAYVGFPAALADSGAERGRVEVWTADTDTWSLEQVLEPRSFEPAGCRLGGAPSGALLPLLFPCLARRRRPRR